MAIKLPSLFALWGSGQSKRLTIGFVISVAMHIMVMLVHFTMPEMAAARAPSLDVILVNARHNTAPKDPQALAQANLDGGGDSIENIRTTSPLPPQSSLHNGNDVLEMMKGQTASVRQQQHNSVLTQQDGSVAIAKPMELEDKSSTPQPATGSDAMNATPMDLQAAEIAAKFETYNQRPRRKHIGPRTREHRFAQYMEGWRTKAEHIGEMNFPAAARGGKMYDDLVMTVSIKKDGFIEKVVINRPSKYPKLNEAAEKIVRLGEPYAQFPPEIAKDTDILDITRTWIFTNNKIGVTTK